MLYFWGDIVYLFFFLDRWIFILVKAYLGEVVNVLPTGEVLLLTLLFFFLCLFLLGDKFGLGATFGTILAFGWRSKILELLCVIAEGLIRANFLAVSSCTMGFVGSIFFRCSTFGHFFLRLIIVIGLFSFALDTSVVLEPSQ